MHVQFSSLESVDASSSGRRRDMRDDSADILLQSTVSSSGTGRFVHALTVSTQHFLCRQRRHPLSTVTLRMVGERLSWRATCPKPCELPSLDSCQKGFLRAHKKATYTSQNFRVELDGCEQSSVRLRSGAEGGSHSTVRHLPSGTHSCGPDVE